MRFADKGYLGSILRVKASELPGEAFTPCAYSRKDCRGLRAALRQILCDPCTSPKGGRAVQVKALTGLSHHEMNSAQASCLRQLVARKPETEL